MEDVIDQWSDQPLPINGLGTHCTVSRVLPLILLILTLLEAIAACGVAPASTSTTASTISETILPHIEATKTPTEPPSIPPVKTAVAESILTPFFYPGPTLTVGMVITSTPSMTPKPTSTSTSTATSAPDHTKTTPYSYTPTETIDPNVVREVRGQVVEVLERNSREIGVLRVLDEDGKEWEFTTDGWIGVEANHLKVHQKLKSPVLVLFSNRDGLLVALEVLD